MPGWGAVIVHLPLSSGECVQAPAYLRGQLGELQCHGSQRREHDAERLTQHEPEHDTGADRERCGRKVEAVEPHARVGEGEERPDAEGDV